MANAGTGAVKIIDNDNDVVTVTNNKLDVNATLVAGASIDIGDVEVTGHSSIGNKRNTDVDSSSNEQFTTDDTPCKHVDLMEATSNTGIIYVGGSSCTASNSVALYPGDVYSMDISNLNLIYVMASVDNQTVMATYFN